MSAMSRSTSGTQCVRATVSDSINVLLDRGVAWDDLGDSKPSVRALRLNKSSWKRALKERAASTAARPVPIEQNPAAGEQPQQVYPLCSASV